MRARSGRQALLWSLLHSFAVVEVAGGLFFRQIFHYERVVAQLFDPKWPVIAMAREGEFRARKGVGEWGGIRAVDLGTCPVGVELKGIDVPVFIVVIFPLIPLGTILFRDLPSPDDLFGIVLFGESAVVAAARQFYRIYKRLKIVTENLVGIGAPIRSRFVGIDRSGRNIDIA